MAADTLPCPHRHDRDLDSIEHGSCGNTAGQMLERVLDRRLVGRLGTCRVSVRRTPPVGLADVQLGWLSGETPGEQLVELRDLVIGDAAEHIGQPGLGIDAVELGGLDQGVGDGG